MVKWNIVAKDWVFTGEFANNWYKYGYASKSPTSGEINSSDVGPFLESLPQQGIDNVVIDVGIFSIVLPAPKPKPRPKSELEVTDSMYFVNTDAAAAAAASQSENTTLGSV